MNLINIILVALGLSMDAFAVSAAKGLRKSNLTFALSISLCFGLFQAGMAIIGYFAGGLFTGFVVNFHHWIAFGILNVIGINMVCDAVFGKKNGVVLISFWGLMLLGVATSIDALAIGVNFAFTGLDNIFLAAGIIGLTTFLVSFIGVFFGKLLGSFLVKYAEIIGGLILIVIGTRILFLGSI